MMRTEADITTTDTAPDSAWIQQVAVAMKLCDGSAEKLAKQIGVSSATVHNWRKGKTRPMPVYVIKVRRLVAGLPVNDAADITKAYKPLHDGATESEMLSRLLDVLLNQKFTKGARIFEARRQIGRWEWRRRATGCTGEDA